MRYRACPHCGLVQTIPPLNKGDAAFCARCESRLLRRSSMLRSNSRTAAIALAALILYPLAIALPILRIEQFGHDSSSSILTGVRSLLAEGHIAIGLIVAFCSVVLPLGKLLALLILSMGELFIGHRHRARTYRIVELTGRWGMLDVLLVAVLVALVKLGDIVAVQPGPGALAFATVVVLSLIAAACFDPHSFWEHDHG